MNRKLLPALLCVAAVVAFAVLGCKRAQPPAPVPAAAGAGAATGAGQPAKGAVKVAVVPKLIGIDYFTACEIGAKEAAKELGVDLIYDGPADNRPDKQIEMINNFITRKVDVIAVAPNDPVSIAPVLNKARQRGIHVITWDADADAKASGREYFVNQAPNDSIGKALIDIMAKHAGPEARAVIITGSLTAANQNIWIAEMAKHKDKAYPKMAYVTDPQPSEEDQNMAFKVTQDVIKAHPEIQGVFGITSVSLPGAAEAVRQMNLTGKVVVTGLSTPNSMKSYVKDGTVKSFVLWNPIDLGYLTVCVAKDLAEGKLKPDSKTADGRRLGQKEIRNGDEVILGAPFEFTKENIDGFNF
ncbi:MAG TPA: substrate-binding domain-containing protein [Candidatus Brocadiia bacterium]|nr:substrate-binding domain-containing protein [Candidatus Brocadiia bacterium]